ncbi:hypothetical protein MA16_Dca027252 [Dendrobium catenatum]|uniref:Uncharacterized protein n=1 Tax=Dendrobium catenatum TaxID=906689 RepID=A0A2I0V919_9ASPA|nr:hypothetical protein MA16_Dca027252 [Dendrobium catenatum]
MELMRIGKGKRWREYQKAERKAGRPRKKRKEFWSPVRKWEVGAVWMGRKGVDQLFKGWEGLMATWEGMQCSVECLEGLECSMGYL